MQMVFTKMTRNMFFFGNQRYTTQSIKYTQTTQFCWEREEISLGILESPKLRLFNFFYNDLYIRCHSMNYTFDNVQYIRFTDATVNRSQNISDAPLS